MKNTLLTHQHLEYYCVSTTIKWDFFLHLLPTGYMESQRCIAVEGDADGDSGRMKINHYVSNAWLKYFNTLSWAEAYNAIQV